MKKNRYEVIWYSVEEVDGQNKIERQGERFKTLEEAYFAYNWGGLCEEMPEIELFYLEDEDDTEPLAIRTLWKGKEEREEVDLIKAVGRDEYNRVVSLAKAEIEKIRTNPLYH